MTQGLQHPTNVTELESLLGLRYGIRLFVPNFAGSTTPLNHKLEKDKPFHFGQMNETGIEALEKLQHRLLLPKYWNYQD